MEQADTLTVSSPEGLSVQLAFLIMVHLVGLLLNLACLFVVCRRYKSLELKRRYILLCNLLLCDFILLFWVMPVTVRLLSCGSAQCRATVLHPEVCSATAFLFQCSYVSGMVTQVLLALDRTLTTAHPYLSVTYLSGRVYAGAVVLCWTFAAFHASLPLAPQFTGVSYVFSDMVKRCTHSFRHSCWYYTYVSVLLHGVIAPGVLACYIYMAFRIWQLRSRLNLEQETLLTPNNSSTADICKNNIDFDYSNDRLSKLPGNGQKRTAISISDKDGSGDFLRTGISVTLTSEVSEVFPEFLHEMRQPEGVAEKGIQTSFTRLTSSRAEFEGGGLSEISRTRDMEDSFATWLSGPFVDTTVDGITSGAISLLNYVPSDASDLKGFILTQQRQLHHHHGGDALSGLFSLGGDGVWVEQEDRPVMAGGARARGSKTLSEATAASIQHGVCLVAVTYAWSLPYTVATRCPRGEMPFVFSLMSVWLCYTSCIFYPLVYFFMHENFIRHFRVSISSL